MSTQSKACPQKGYKTAYDALFSPDGKAIPDDGSWECERCKRCQLWHIRPLPKPGKANA